MFDKIDAILFDVDGTLWDAVPAVYQAWKDELAEKGYECNFSMEKMMSLFGQQVNAFGDELFPDLPVDERRALAHECADHQIARMRENRLLYPYNGVKKTLKLLSQHYPLYIVTNAKKGYAELFLEFTGTEEYIKECQHAAVGKTKAENMRDVMERNGLKNVVYVGDTAMDQTSSQEAGARFIWASYGFGGQVENDLVIDSITQLPAFFGLELE